MRSEINCVILGVLALLCIPSKGVGAYGPPPDAPKVTINDSIRPGVSPELRHADTGNSDYAFFASPDGATPAIRKVNVNAQITLNGMKPLTQITYLALAHTIAENTKNLGDARPTKLIIALRDADDSMENFATGWADLVASRRDVVVAIPQNDKPSTHELAVIIADAAAHFHADKASVILAGYSTGGELAGIALNELPSQFAGVAIISAPVDFLLKPNFKPLTGQLAIFISIGNREDLAPLRIKDFNATVNQLKEFGYNTLQANESDRSHALSSANLSALSKQIMTFMDANIDYIFRQRQTAVQNTQSQASNSDATAIISASSLGTNSTVNK